MERIFSKADLIHQMIKAKDIEDGSILAFEILFLTVALKTKSNDLKWLSTISSINNIEKRKLLGGSYYNMLSEWARKSICGTYQDGRGKLEMIGGIIGKAFFELTTVYSAYNNGKCGNYYCDTITPEIIFSIKKFSELVSIIGYD